MRVISGEYGGRPLKAVPGKQTRPTTDKVKESLFNLIGPYFDGGLVLDLYSGSGSLGIEAVSRGMDHAFLVDAQYKAIQTIQSNVEMTKQEEKFSVWKKKSSQALQRLAKEDKKFELVLLDPPYAKQTIVEDVETLIENNLLSDQANIVCETDDQTTLPEQIGSCALIKEKKYGNTKIWVYEMSEEA